ncbi:MAG: hypothetical protein QXT13_11385 [Pyrobaculum sp.]
MEPQVERVKVRKLIIDAEVLEINPRKVVVQRPREEEEEEEEE